MNSKNPKKNKKKREKLSCIDFTRSSRPPCFARRSRVAQIAVITRMRFFPVHCFRNGERVSKQTFGLSFSWGKLSLLNEQSPWATWTLVNARARRPCKDDEPSISGLVLRESMNGFETAHVYLINCIIFRNRLPALEIGKIRYSTMVISLWYAVS